MTINELRKAIRPLGFSVRTEILAWGPHATYRHDDTDTKMTFNALTPGRWKTWQPLLDHLNAYPDGTRVTTRDGERIRGCKLGRMAYDGGTP